MRLKQYLNESNINFTSLEDPKIAKEFQYNKLTLNKAPKELSYALKMLRKHLKTPLKSLSYASGPQATPHLAVYSETLDGIGINLTELKKIKKGSFSVNPNDLSYHDKLKINQSNLSKWEAFQEKAVSPKDIKKARGGVNRSKTAIHNLEAKIRNGDVPVPSNAFNYTKNDKEAIENVILHELGHREKSKHDLFKIQVYFNNGEFVSEYSKRNISEYFSEVYSLVKMNLIDRTPISDEAKAFFKKAIK